MTIAHRPTDRLDVSTASRLARTLYGLEAEVRPLPGELDDNFHLRTSDGAEFVLKCMHPDRERGLLELQCAALDHLARAAPALQLPRVVPTRAGAPVAALGTGDDAERLVWLLTYVPGRLLAEATPRSRHLLTTLGELLGALDAALQSFAHPAATRELKWDLARAGWIRDYLRFVEPAARRALVADVLARYDSEVIPRLGMLRQSVIHGDANDYNVLVTPPTSDPRRAVSVIDFGDMHHTVTVAELAVAAAYAVLGTADPLAAAVAVVEGYHAAYPLDEAELAVLFPLLCTRLAVSVVNSAYLKTLHPDDPYVTVSEGPAWAALERLAAVHPRFAHYTLRGACGLEPVPSSRRIVAWLGAAAPGAAPVIGRDLRREPTVVFDLSVGSLLLGADPAALETPALTEQLWRELRRAGATVGIGRYDEARPIYTTPLFGGDPSPTAERRTVHLGVDLFAEAGTPVHAPLDGVVRIVANNTARLDYGPLVILEHRTAEGEPFWLLFGHLSAASLEVVAPGAPVVRGQRIGEIGAPPMNGDWPPHLHLQVITDLLELDRDFPGVAFASQRGTWTSLSPDPNALLGIPADRFPAPAPTKAETLAARRAHVGRNLSISYREPLKIVRGWMQYLYDETGRAYLDCYNNVPVVGHSHPRVVRAIQQQTALLTTNTRYLHDNLTRYAERLAALMPAPLEVCYFVNSASEANELALRLARAHTGREDMIVLEAAYHGHTSALIDLSPYKFAGPGGRGRRPWVHVAPIPDDYRGPYRRDDPEAGPKYARHVAELVEQLQRAGRGLAGYIAETLPSVGGQIVLPPGYLRDVYAAVRAAGGVCIADEVQVGFGRLGTHLWGFETQGVVPDIVVLGKPIGNGHPLGAVVTTAAIARSFDNGMEFFSTFGGNPVACAAGLAVLDVLAEEGLQAHAHRVGRHLLDGLRARLERHRVVGDVRGAGLFLGVELVLDRERRTPAPEVATYVVNRLRECQILTGTDGPWHNVIKIRPPLVFNERDADHLMASLDEVLADDLPREASS
jgi:4-aminobutyrate aminotransferase-like enzyme/Ser/Thr protein kinase RdoA (MazF antagonist)